jgi:hypothetical protein
MNLTSLVFLESLKYASINSFVGGVWHLDHNSLKTLLEK